MIHRVAGDETAPVADVPLPAEPLELEACYRYCEAVTRSKRHNFPVASMFVPTALRRHIFAVYAFARQADDFADEPRYDGQRARELDLLGRQARGAVSRRAARSPHLRRARRHRATLRPADHAVSAAAFGLPYRSRPAALRHRGRPQELRRPRRRAGRAPALVPGRLPRPVHASLRRAPRGRPGVRELLAGPVGRHAARPHLRAARRPAPLRSCAKKICSRGARRPRSVS